MEHVGRASTQLARPCGDEGMRREEIDQISANAALPRRLLFFAFLA